MTQTLPAHTPLPEAGEWYRDVPRSIRSHVIFGLCLMAVAFGGFGAWAFRAPLAAAVISQGSFVATGRNKIVQHLEGGIISEILVSEGDVVEEGDVILRLDQTAALANRRELGIRKARLEATAARLLAEHNAFETIRFPDDLLEEARNEHEVAEIIDGQKNAFRSARVSLENDLALLERNINALDIRSIGYKTQLASHVRLVELLTDEYETKAKLFADGLIRQSEANALQRAVIEAQGQIGRLEAEVNELEQLRLRHQTQVQKARGMYRETALDELQVIQGELESVREKHRKAESVLVRSDVVAPVAGTVIRMHYFSSGGVIETGKPIAEILPSNAPLIIETLIPRNDIDTVHQGQAAVVRLSALNTRTTPVLNGTVDYISADALADTRNGEMREVYIARITLAPEELARVRGFAPTPGMPAEVMIQTAERTFAQYIAKPVVDSMSRAFREQ